MGAAQAAWGDMSSDEDEKKSKPKGYVNKHGLDVNKQVYIEQRMTIVKDPAKMPRIINDPDWEPETSRIGKKYRVIAKNGATVRAGVELTTEKVGMVDVDDVVEVIDATRDGARVRIEDPYEGWISAKVLMPHSVLDTKNGLKMAPIFLDESVEDVWAKGVDPKQYDSPYNWNPEEAIKKLPKGQQEAHGAVKAAYNQKMPFTSRIQPANWFEQ